MPEYIYRCAECGNFRNIKHGISEDPDIKCSQCGNAMQRRPMTVAVSFKGDGFYSKDKNNG